MKVLIYYLSEVSSISCIAFSTVFSERSFMNIMVLCCCNRIVMVYLVIHLYMYVL